MSIEANNNDDEVDLLSVTSKEQSAPFKHVQRSDLLQSPLEGYEEITKIVVKAPEWFAAGGLFFRSTNNRYSDKKNREKSGLCRGCENRIRASKLRGHVQECKRLAAELNLQFTEDLRKSQKEIVGLDLVHLHLVLGLIEKNIPFNAYGENDSMKIHYQLVAKHCGKSAYSPPSTKTLSTTILEKAYDYCHEKVMERLKNESPLTLQLDGLTDVCQGSLYGIVASSATHDYVLKVTDISDRRHFASTILSIVEDVLAENDMNWQGIEEMFIQVETVVPLSQSSEEYDPEEDQDKDELIELLDDQWLRENPLLEEYEEDESEEEDHHHSGEESGVMLVETQQELIDDSPNTSSSQDKEKQKKKQKVESNIVGMRYWFTSNEYSIIVKKATSHSSQESSKASSTDKVVDWNAEDLLSYI